MKNLKIIATFMFAAILIIACEKNNNNLDQTLKPIENHNEKSKSDENLKSLDNFSEFEIYYLNEQYDEVSITVQEFKNFILNTNENVPSNTVINGIEIIVNSTTHDDLIKAELVGIGDYSIFIDANPSGLTAYNLGAKDCSCTGVNCTGCNLSINGSNCSCSPCSFGGTCTKEESGSTSATYSASLFL